MARVSDVFSGNYLKASDLQGKAVRVTIESNRIESMGDDKKPVLHFVGKDKGLVLNRTNAARLVEATGSDEMDDWRGWSIVLFPCKVDFQGKRVDAIRIDDRPNATRQPQHTRRAAAPPPPPPPAPEPDEEFIEEANDPRIDDDIPF
jgi:hypothetical protein